MSVGAGPRAGEEVAGYRIEALIGRGGMGAVYRAEDVRLGRKVALKLLIPDLAEDERFRERFLRESRVAASLDHPNIVPIYQAGEAGGSLFIAMRYVEGTDLGRLLSDVGRLPTEQALALLEQVADALDAAHRAGLVHRDVKPANVLLTSSSGREHCYLADFGLTKQASSVSGLTGTGQLVGTLDYVAPEQIKGDPVDAHADVYALACVAFECFAGVPPFQRPTEAAVLWAHMNEKPPSLHERRPELPHGIDIPLARALAKNPKDRFATCGEFVAALRRELPTPVPHERPPLHLPYRLRRHRKLAAVGALIVAGVIALAAVLVTRSGSHALAALAPNSVGVIDPATNTIVADVPLGHRPTAVAVGDGGVWVAEPDRLAIARVDPVKRHVTRVVTLEDFPADVAVAGGTVWVALGVTNVVARLPANGSATPRGIPIPGFRTGVSNDRGGTEIACRSAEPIAVAARGATAWFACPGTLGTIDASTNALKRVQVSLGSASLAAGLGAVWIADASVPVLGQFDPRTLQETRQLALPAQGETLRSNVSREAIAVGEGAIWVAIPTAGVVLRVDIHAGLPSAAATIAVGHAPVAIAAGEGAVWVVDRDDHTLTRVDPATNDVAATIDLGNVIPHDVAVGDGRVWVTAEPPFTR